MKRRDFLKTSALGVLGFISVSAGKVLGANDNIRVGIIGIGRQGCYHARRLSEMSGVKVVALADPDPGYKMGQLQKELSNNQNRVDVDIYTDYRRLLDRKDIDAVVVASCNHWHSLHGIHAVQAGKHVYIEKPVSNDLWQGRQLTNAARNSGLVVQTGLQHRSRYCWPEAIEYLKEGHLGKIICSRGLCYKQRNSIGLLDSPLSPPQSCDYDLWLGPAQDLPIMRPNFHYDWHWVWNTGSGDIGNQGPHQVDIARWMLGQNGYPENIISIGGRFGYEDAGQTPNTQIVFYDYKPVPMIFEVRGLTIEPDIRAMPLYKKTRIGNVIECEGGYIAEETIYDNDGKRIGKFTAHGAENHLPKFIEAVRNKDCANVAGSIEDGHISSALCHLANISYRLGNQAAPDEIAGIKSDPLKSEALQRFAEHLEAHGIDLDKQRPTVGAALTFDGVAERFTGSFSQQANSLLKGDYRQNYIVPQIKLRS